MPIIKKDTLLEVRHVRKGNFTGVALKDFDTEKEEFYPIAVALKEGSPSAIQGMNVNNVWHAGDEIPCRNSLCTIKPI